MVEEKVLIENAIEASKKAYAPYSKFHVGAALLTKSGKIFQGCNIENVSFGATNCAERSAVFAAYSNGYRLGDFEALAIVTEADNITAPCGICRQVLNELIGKDLPVILSNGRQTIETNIGELLPMSFDRILSLTL